MLGTTPSDPKKSATKLRDFFRQWAGNILYNSRYFSDLSTDDVEEETNNLRRLLWVRLRKAPQDYIPAKATYELLRLEYDKLVGSVAKLSEVSRQPKVDPRIEQTEEKLRLGTFELMRDQFESLMRSEVIPESLLEYYQAKLQQFTDLLQQIKAVERPSKSRFTKAAPDPTIAMFKKLLQNSVELLELVEFLAKLSDDSPAAHQRYAADIKIVDSDIDVIGVQWFKQQSDKFIEYAFKKIFKDVVKLYYGRWKSTDPVEQAKAKILSGESLQTQIVRMAVFCGYRLKDLDDHSKIDNATIEEIRQTWPDPKVQAECIKMLSLGQLSLVEYYKHREFSALMLRLGLVEQLAAEMNALVANNSISAVRECIEGMQIIIDRNVSDIIQLRMQLQKSIKEDSLLQSYKYSPSSAADVAQKIKECDKRRELLQKQLDAATAVLAANSQHIEELSKALHQPTIEQRAILSYVRVLPVLSLHADLTLQADPVPSLYRFDHLATAVAEIKHDSPIIDSAKYWKSEGWCHYVESLLLQNLSATEPNLDSASLILTTYSQNNSEKYRLFLAENFHFLADKIPSFVEKISPGTIERLMEFAKKASERVSAVPDQALYDDELLNYLSDYVMSRDIPPEEVRTIFNAIAAYAKRYSHLTADQSEKIDAMLNKLQMVDSGLFNSYYVKSTEVANISFLLLLSRHKVAIDLNKLRDNLPGFITQIDLSDKQQLDDVNKVFTDVFVKIHELPYPASSDHRPYQSEEDLEFRQVQTVQIFITKLLKAVINVKQPLRRLEILLKAFPEIPESKAEDKDNPFAKLLFIFEKTSKSTVKQDKLQRTLTKRAFRFIYEDLLAKFNDFVKDLDLANEDDARLLKQALTALFKLEAKDNGKNFRWLCLQMLGLQAGKHTVIEPNINPTKINILFQTVKDIGVLDVYDLNNIINEEMGHLREKFAKTKENVAAYIAILPEYFSLIEAKFGKEEVLLKLLGVDLQKDLDPKLPEKLKDRRTRANFPRFLPAFIAELQVYAETFGGRKVDNMAELLDYIANSFKGNDDRSIDQDVRRRFIEYLNVIIWNFIDNSKLENEAEVNQLKQILQWLGQVSYKDKDGADTNVSGDDFLKASIARSGDAIGPDKVQFALQHFLRSMPLDSTNENANPFVLLSRQLPLGDFRNEATFNSIFELAQSGKEPWKKYWQNCGNETGSIILYLCGDASASATTIDERLKILKAILGSESDHISGNDSVISKLGNEFFLGFMQLCTTSGDDHANAALLHFVAKRLFRTPHLQYSLKAQIVYSYELYQADPNSTRAKILIGAHDEAQAKAAREISDQFYAAALKQHYGEDPNAGEMVDLSIYFMLIKCYLDDKPDDPSKVKQWQALLKICGIDKINNKEYLDRIDNGQAIAFAETYDILIKKFPDLNAMAAALPAMGSIDPNLLTVLRAFGTPPDLSDTRDIDQHTGKGHFANPEARQFIRYCAMLVIGDQNKEVESFINDPALLEEKLLLMQASLGDLPAFKRIFEKPANTEAMFELLKKYRELEQAAQGDIKLQADFDVFKGAHPTLIQDLERELRQILLEAERIYLQSFQSAMESGGYIGAGGEYLNWCRTGIFVRFLSGVYKPHYRAPTHSRLEFIENEMPKILASVVESVFNSLPIDDSTEPKIRKQADVQSFFDALFTFDSSNRSMVITSPEKEIAGMFGTLSGDTKMYKIKELDEMRAIYLSLVFGDIASLAAKINDSLPEAMRGPFTPEEKALMLKLACEGIDDKTLAQLRKTYFLRAEEPVVTTPVLTTRKLPGAEA